ncbi:MAG TPA: biotin--[acetyl-CoA-carboxylase] ligase [Candidatus Scybalocola faecavium]|nr:biotin--[acetyl-CoA-carboxylase] ligase [Candidatus Scybalocola faecavium]
MGTKSQLLKLFEENKGTYLSGEDIAERLSISRTAVWKAVNSLRKDGYDIDAVPNRGYCLSIQTDILSVQGIRKYLAPICRELKLEVFPSVTSTNTVLKEQAAAGAPEGTAILAGAQTQGRGRIGRSFYSPSDTGIYLSILLRPNDCSPLQATKLTTMAAVAACEAIEAAARRSAQIKWVNDIFIDGKKVCGILTEASFGLESGHLDYAVLGIGFNAYTPEGGFPENIESIAGSIFLRRENDGKNRLAAEFLNHFMDLYSCRDDHAYVEKYRQRSLVLGKRIRILSPSGTIFATALDVDDQCRLVVRYDDGSTQALSSGEISIRLS